MILLEENSLKIMHNKYTINLAQITEAH